ncbi:MAG: hypothetical protein DRN95_02690 [Candidatus Hydrothermarchaeota archaeon]|nr:MAG: hypothetical protein DRN95_02690 [Candidatus Hydrothermarchaeota archaeon]
MRVMKRKRRKRKKCKGCGKYLTKNLRELGKSNFVEEYRDGLCVDCWINKNRKELTRAKICLISC